MNPDVVRFIIFSESGPPAAHHGPAEPSVATVAWLVACPVGSRMPGRQQNSRTRVNMGGGGGDEKEVNVKPFAAVLIFPSRKGGNSMQTQRSEVHFYDGQPKGQPKKGCKYAGNPDRRRQTGFVVV
ncbi:helicase mot1-like protein [Anopheles sinensis]|uniref:Helicase mot1-like protein n=1 Tax=Anopheles sinensis TaxID=74873 RepID=A0A084WTA8_ANOSI|nr:helicase mot1-like protein [Anopheles sinensis]